MRRVSAVLAMMLTLVGAHARAEEKSPASSTVLSTSDSATSSTRVIEEWYGWQILLVDAAAISTVVVGLKKESMNLVVAGALGYGLLPPIVHAAHGDLDAAGLSFVVRMVGGSVGPGVCALAVSGDKGNAEGFKSSALATCLVFGVPLTVLGVLGATAIDAGPLSRHKRTVPLKTPQALHVIPLATATPGGGQLYSTFELENAPSRSIKSGWRSISSL